MTRHLLTLTAVAALAAGLAACGDRSEPEPAAPASEAVADTPASEAAPAEAAASDVVAETPAETPALEPTEPDPDEVAAAGDTRRRTDESPPPPTQ